MPHNTAASGASPPTGTRSRLRGFSYLRSHGHHQSSPSNTSALPPSINPDQANSGLNATNNNNNNNNNNNTTSPPASPTVPRRSTSPLTNNNSVNNGGSTSAWLPTVGGVSGLSRVPTAPAAESSTAVGGFRSNLPQTNGISSTDADGTSPVARSVSEGIPVVRSIDAALSSGDGQNSTSPVSPNGQQGDPLPSIRFVPHIDPRSTRQSLTFSPMERALRHNNEVIRVGRYSDRDAGNPLPVGFKSKVVSRRHCEFWCANGQWYVKDVKSSSGTFLNHIRLSSPGVESKAFPLFDGDIIQLGIDFKGGEELIFRCVKIRVELNRAWQKALNSFNVSTHKKFIGQTLKKAKDSDGSSTHTSECAICLMNVAPCQSLFVAPCSHVWHYKCVRPIILKSYPTFLCPNCRAVADLERDIEDDGQWQVVEEEPAQGVQSNVNTHSDQDEDAVVITSESVQNDNLTQDEQTSPAVDSTSQETEEMQPTDSEQDHIYNENQNIIASNVGVDGSTDEPIQTQFPTTNLAALESGNETFIGTPSLDSDMNRLTLDPAQTIVSSGDENAIQINSGEGTSSQPLRVISPKRKPVKKDSSGGGPPTLAPMDFSITTGGSSRNGGDTAENTLSDSGPLTPKNHIGPFILDGIVERN